MLQDLVGSRSFKFNPSPQRRPVYKEFLWTVWRAIFVQFHSNLELLFQIWSKPVRVDKSFFKTNSNAKICSSAQWLWCELMEFLSDKRGIYWWHVCSSDQVRVGCQNDNRLLCGACKTFLFLPLLFGLLMHWSSQIRPEISAGILKVGSKILQVVAHSLLYHNLQRSFILSC